MERRSVDHYSEGENWSELEVIENHRPWILYLVNKATRNFPKQAWRHLKVTQEDMVQEAIIALLGCWRTYQKNKIECPFGSFAYKRLWGSIIDSFREGRCNKAEQKQIKLRFISIDEPVEEDGVYGSNYNDILKQVSYTVKYGEMIDLERALNSLEKWERNFIQVFYYNGEGLKSIGERAGVSESRACQVHKAIIKKLRDYMEVDKSNH